MTAWGWPAKDGGWLASSGETLHAAPRLAKGPPPALCSTVKLSLSASQRLATGKPTRTSADASCCLGFHNGAALQQVIQRTGRQLTRTPLPTTRQDAHPPSQRHDVCVHIHMPRCLRHCGFQDFFLKVAMALKIERDRLCRHR